MTFKVGHLDDDEWEYSEDDYRVEVKIRDRENGGRVSVVIYTTDGDRLSYHPFRINSVDGRRLVYAREERTEIPDVVRHAIHAGGWEVTNLYYTSILPEENDPMLVQLLDLRDMLADLAKRQEFEVMMKYFEGMSRVAEHGVVHYMTFVVYPRSAKGAKDQVDEMDPDRRAMHTMEMKKANNEVPEEMGYDSIDDLVEGGLMNAIDPSTMRRREYHDYHLKVSELARTLYRGGEPLGDALAKAFQVLGPRP